MSTSRRDLTFRINYDASADTFSVAVLSQIEIVDVASNRTLTDQETVLVDFDELDAAEQALGLQFIAAVQGARDGKRPVILP